MSQEFGPEADTSHWPKGVKPITIGQSQLIGVDANGVLHWDGKPVEVGRRVTLSWWQIIGAVIVTLAALAGAIGTGVQAWAAVCTLGYLGCPKPPAAGAER